jgi:hypothetical protein
MVAPLIPALLSLAPSIIGLFTKGGSTAEKVLNTAVDVGKAITGKENPDDIAEALKADPAKLLEYQRQMNDQAVAMYQEETKRLETVNKTIQAEVNSNDAYVRRWRPTFGYAVAFTWTVQMTAVSASIVMVPKDAPAIITALVSLSAIWGIALAVLGVSVHKRSQDKAVANGAELQPGIIGRVIGAIKKP